MKQLKHISILFVAVLALLLLLTPKAEAATVAKGTCGAYGDDLTWSLDDQGVLTISGVGSISDYYYDFLVPWYENRNDIKAVAIGEGVTAIGKNTFSYCSNLNSVVIPNSVTSIGSYSFRSCTALMSVTIPNSVTSIGDYAFNCCTALTIIHIPGSVSTIGEGAFCYCNGLTSVNIGNGVVTIDNSAFSDCHNLTSVIIPDSVTTIGERAFSWCDSLESLSIPESVIFIDDLAFSFCYSLTSVVIPNSTEFVGDGAFSYCTGLTSVIIGDSVATIGGGAFQDCSSLTSVFIPDSVTTIGKYVFANCRSLNGIWVDENSSAYSNDSHGVLFNKNKTELIQAPGNLGGAYSIPESVTVIQEEAFCACLALTSVTVPDSVTTIGKYTFAGCTELTAVTLGNNIKTIEEYTFSHCSNLASISIGNKVQSIEAWAFYYCTSLATIAIPDSVSAIKMYAFQNCSDLKAIAIPDSVSSIERYAFSDCTGLTSVIIGNGITTISEQTFYNCTSLNSVIIGNGVEVIDDKAFCNCTSLNVVMIPDSVIIIGNSAFENCGGLISVSIGNSVTTVGDSAFKDCISLSDVRFSGTAPAFNTLSGTNKTFRCVVATAYYPVNDSTWTSSKRQNYGGTITWIPYESLFAVYENKQEKGWYTTINKALESNGYVKLLSDARVNASLTKDLYVDLNGFDLSGTIVTNGYRIYGMDSTTNKYTCENRGVFACKDAQGKTVVPETHFKSAITGTIMRYMAIRENAGYSFHRFYLGITHMSIRPSVTSVGFKATFCGDEMVIEMLDADRAYGYSLGVGSYNPVSAFKSRESFESGRTVTLRIDNYDIENYGETMLTAKAILKLADGTVIESSGTTMTFRQLMENLNNAPSQMTAQQLEVITGLISKHPIIKTWNLNNLLG